MARSSAGTRIRERRIELGMRQAALAKSVGISASYLNLIEHDRRRIGGKLVLELSRVLGVEPSHFSDTARAELAQTLRQTVAKQDDGPALAATADVVAGRAPQWAEFIIAQNQRLEEQAQIIAALTDRLAHDPNLAASVHEVLSVITSVRSTAGILANEDDLDSEWLARFHRNIYEDSQRLAASAQALVAYLEEAEDEAADSAAHLVVEDFEDWLKARNYFVADLEGPDANVDRIVDNDPDLGAVQSLADYARGHFDRYLSDAAALPLSQFGPRLGQRPFPDPLELAHEFSCGFATLMRRIASMPADVGPECGLVICDSSGTISFRREIEGFPMPRFGAACPLWPLYRALSEPGRPIRSAVQHIGYDAGRFVSFAIAEPKLAARYDGEQVFEATMLILPVRVFGSAAEQEEPRQIGTSCRICPRRDCAGRREPPVGGYH